MRRSTGFRECLCAGRRSFRVLARVRRHTWGVVLALRFATNLLVRPDVRRRVRDMRRTFRQHREHLGTAAIIAHEPDPDRPDSRRNGRGKTTADST
jgi:hypothetical protein